MRIYQWKDLLDGNFMLQHIYSSHTWPLKAQQGGGSHPRALNGLVLYLGGNIRMMPPYANLDVHPGSLVYYPAGACYSAQVDLPDTHYEQVEFILMNDACEVVTLAADPILLYRECPLVFRLKISEMVRIHNFGGLASGLRSHSLLYDLIYNIALEKFMDESKLSGYQRILPAILYLEQHYTKDITVKQLADMSDMGITWFRTLFSKYSGMSPVEYRNSLRIRRACDLLKIGEHNVSEVADMTGFGNVYYFSRAFKKATGKTPSSILHSE